MHVVIIGNGFAGVSAIETLRTHGEGVRITLASAEDCGFYSPASLFAYLEGRVRRADLFLRRKEDYEAWGVETFFGKRVVRLETAQKRVYLEDGTTIGYDRLLIATGASAKGMSVKGIASRGVFYLRSLDDADRIRACGAGRAVVVGAGRIGVEMAATLREMGAEVSLVESEPEILPGVFGRELAAAIKELLQARGVRVHTAESIIEVRGDPVNAVRTERRDLPCDMVVVAVGRRPNVDFVDGGGVALGATGGIRVDRHLRAADDVYAAGDCAESVDFLGRPAVNAVIPTALETGRIAALNILGRPTPYHGSIAGNVLRLFGRAFCAVGDQDGEKVVRRAGDGVQVYTLQGDRLVGVQFVESVPEAARALGAIRRGIRTPGPFTPDALRRQLFLPIVYPNVNRGRA